MTRKLNIHGDNIVECERAFKLCKKALNIEEFKIVKETSLFCPTFHVSTETADFIFTFFPGYGRWNFNILSLIQNTENSLREAPDVLITEIENGKETPLIAIEYCGALAAGNQAWQRSGRGYSAGMSKIPYLYVAEIGGFELDTNTRERKAARLPNAAVPFSYLTYSHERSPVLPIYERSAGTDDITKESYKNVFAEDELVEIVGKILTKQDFSEVSNRIEEKVLEFVKIRSAVLKKNNFDSADWQNAYDSLKNNGHFLDFVEKSDAIKYKKKIADKTIATETARKFISLACEYAVGISSSDLPFCLIPKETKEKFLSEIKTLYPNLTKEFKDWFANSKRPVIVLLNGFKHGGDDARPDRGLAPFARMLTGKEADILTFVYGPSYKANWKIMEENPRKLGERNEIWEAIFSASDAVIADSATSDMKKISFIKSEFRKQAPKQVVYKTLLPSPIKIGENDVDTILHTIFTQLKSSEIKIFEGMCNPPGGDWSGISVLSNMFEYRWLSLPRVSHSGAKRPDHVFEITGIETRPIIISVESKETARALEENIGENLNRYLTDLMDYPVNAKRSLPAGEWKYDDTTLDSEDFLFASAAAYICMRAGDFELVENKVGCDIIFSYYFGDNGKCRINISSYSELGKKIAEAICKAECPLENLSLVVV